MSQWYSVHVVAVAGALMTLAGFIAAHLERRPRLAERSRPRWPRR